MTHLVPVLAQAADAAKEAEEASGGTSTWLTLLIVAAFLIVPFVLGELIARALKMKDRALRFGVVLFALALGMAPFVSLATQGRPMSDAFKLGIDLAGGMNIVFEVDAEQAKADGKDIDDTVMQNMVGAIARRINPAGTKEIVVRKVGQQQLEIIVPDVDAAGAQEVVDTVTTLGELEFAILASDRKEKYSDYIEEASEMDDDEKELMQADRLVAAWKPVARNAEGKEKDFLSGQSIAQHGLAQRTVKSSVATPDGGTKVVDVTEFLVVFEPEQRRVKGRDLTTVRAARDPSNNSPIVSFNLNTGGAYNLQQLTSDHLPNEEKNYHYHLAILLDGKLESAPTVNGRISNSGQISGDFTMEEVQSLVDILNAGALQVPLKTEDKDIQKKIVDPTLGAAVAEKGKTAIIWSSIIVLVFMVAYYFVAGAIADLCLVFNIVLVLGTMAFIDATFTLPGLAGIVLTIGMAVDANVLIFERIREEQARGSSLKMAIQNGFDRAFTTIVDANLTTLITAIVLYMIGTDQIKGFAVTLFIGIVMGMFTALYFGRLMFEILERKRILKSIKMAPAFGRGLGIDFIGKRKIAALASLLLIVAGLAAFASRGKDNFDIDLTGGTMVSFEFLEEQELASVQEKLDGAFEDPVKVERLRDIDEADAQKVKRFRLRSRDPETANVAAGVEKAFEGDASMQLVKLKVDVGEITNTEVDGETVSRFDLAMFEMTPDGEQPREFPASVITGNLIDALKKIDGKKYGSTESVKNMIEIEGTAGSGIDASEADPNKTYTEFDVIVSNGVSSDDLASAISAVQKSYADRPWFPENTTFGTAFAAGMRWKGVLAFAISLLAIIGYIWLRFQRITFGFAAVVALVHDILVVLGLMAIGAYLAETPVGPLLGLTDFKIDLPMIAAFLTIVGYSLNDTIVVFDRIREVRGKNPALNGDMINRSLNQTLNRTLMTSVTTMIVVAILYIWGGEGIHGFAFCLVLGVIVGTYSSIFVASPTLLWLMNRPGVAPRRAGAPVAGKKATS